MWCSYMERVEATLIFVLAQFQAMGATAEELKVEENRLRTDDEYYKEWCVDISKWCSEEV